MKSRRPPRDPSATFCRALLVILLGLIDWPTPDLAARLYARLYGGA